MSNIHRNTPWLMSKNGTDVVDQQYTPIASVYNKEHLRPICGVPDLISTLRMVREELVFGGNWEAAKKQIDIVLTKIGEDKQ